MPTPAEHQNPPAPPPTPMGPGQACALGIYYVVLMALTAYFLVVLWPEKVGNAWDTTVTLCGYCFCLGFETRLILLVAVAGALGSYIHGATSFATYAGNRTLVTSWVWWYLLRTPIGIALALVFYFVIRGGLLSAGAAGDVLSPYGIAAVAGLVGMFSKQATDKLQELFENLFRTAPNEGDAQRKDKLKGATPNPVPTIKAIQPLSVPLGGTGAKLEVSGDNFVKNSVVRVNGSDRDTKPIDANRLAVQLAVEDLATARTLSLTVFNPPPGGGTSEPLEVTVA